MDLKMELKGSKIVLSWADEGADLYKVFCLKNGTFYECASTTGTAITLSLAPYGDGECFVQSYKNGIMIEKSSIRRFMFDTIDVISCVNDGENAEIYYSECQGASGYRLYMGDENQKSFNGVKNSKTFHMTTKYDENILYKIKPYKDGNEGVKDFITTSESFKPLVSGFKSVSLYKSYNFNMFLSWNFEGYADGFEIYTENSDFPIFETNNGLCRCLSLNNYKLSTKFVIKAFVNTFNGRVTVAKSKPVAITIRKYEKPEVSVIVPVYNCEKTIAKTVDSILAQEFDNVEVIIVNNGSTDNTQKIIDWYVQNFKNVTAETIEKTEFSQAVNLGIQNANGEYIAFSGSGCLMRPDMISRLFNLIEENYCEIAIAPLYKVTDKEYEIDSELPFVENTTVDTDKYLEILFTNKYYNYTIWNKLYKASLVKEHPFPQNVKYDVSWTPYILSRADEFCYIKTPLCEQNQTTEAEKPDETLSAEEIIENHKQAVLFILKNGNPDKKDLLKGIAKRYFEFYSKKTNNPIYAKMAELAEKGKLK